jgi:hypothetical protein
MVRRMVGDDRLHDGQAEAGAVLLGGVVGREEALAFFGREAFAGVGDASSLFRPLVGARA